METPRLGEEPSSSSKRSETDFFRERTDDQRARACETENVSPPSDFERRLRARETTTRRSIITVVLHHAVEGEGRWAEEQTGREGKESGEEVGREPSKSRSRAARCYSEARSGCCFFLYNAEGRETRGERRASTAIPDRLAYQFEFARRIQSAPPPPPLPLPHAASTHSPFNYAEIESYEILFCTT